jgi:hypothetical protein
MGSLLALNLTIHDLNDDYKFYGMNGKTFFEQLDHRAREQLAFVQDALGPL